MRNKYVLLLLLLVSVGVNQSKGQTTIPTYVPKSGLVAWWPFDGNANDLSGNGNHGIVKGAVLTSDRYGKRDRAYYFDGKNFTNITVKDNPDQSLDLTGDFTISCWFRADSLYNSVGTVRSILMKSGDGVGEGYGYAHGVWGGTPGTGPTVGYINFQASPYSNNSTIPIGTSGNVNTGTWYCYTVSYERSDSTLKYYINSFMVDKKKLKFRIENNSNELWIGSQPSVYNTVKTFHGKIDDIAIWNRVLSSDELFYFYRSSHDEIVDLKWSRIYAGNCLRVIPNIDSSLLFLSRASDVLKSTNKGESWVSTNWHFSPVRDGFSTSKGGAYSLFNGGMLNVSRLDSGWALSNNNGSNYIASGPFGNYSNCETVVALKDGRFLSGINGQIRGIFKSVGADNLSWVNKYSEQIPYDFALRENGFVICAGYYYLKSRGSILVSYDMGDNWEVINNDFEFPITDVELIPNDDSLLFINSRGELRVSPGYNYKSSFFRYHFNFPMSSFNQMSYSKEKRLLVLSSSNYGIFISNNNGNEWKSYTFNGVTKYRDATIIKDRIYVATDKGLYVTQLNSLTSSCPIANFNPFDSYIYSSTDSIKLDAGPGFTNYNWTDGSISQSIFARKTGGYRVTVTNVEGCTATDSVYVQFSDTIGLHVNSVSAICNKSVDIPVRVTRFRKMLTMQGSLNWNTTDLRFDSVVAFGPSILSMNATNFGTSNVTSGKLTFSWNDVRDLGVTLDDSTVLFTLRFTALGSVNRTVAISLSNDPIPIEFIDSNLVKQSVKTTNGTVSIACELTISGQVLAPSGAGVRYTSITLSGGSGNATTTTNASGQYSFKVLPGTYTLIPSRNVEQEKRNGISTLDIALIQSHILQRRLLDASYKIIAADVDNTSSITTADILYLRRLILGTDTTFSGNRIWAFVDGGQIFTNPLMPFPFSSTKTFTNQSTDVSHIFRGIKIGDVNYDRNPLLDQAPSGDTLRLYGEWTETEDGYVSMKVKSRAVSGLLGWQSTLRWDAKQLQLQSVNGLISNLGIGERWKDDGYLTLSWNDPRAEGLNFTDGVAWMELKFKKTNALQRAGISMTEEKLGTEAFNGNFQSMGVKMEPIELRGNDMIGLMRVYPNPATQYMNVEWKMARSGVATVRLLDAQGRVVHEQRGEYGVGIQRVMIKRRGAWSVMGTWMVQVEVDGEVRNVKVVMGDEAPRP